MLPIPEKHPLKQLFAGLVEHAFQAELGLCDPALTDYVSRLLIDFVHVDNMALADEAILRPAEEIAEVVTKAEQVEDLPGEVRYRFVQRRMGDYTLFWSGVFPEGVRRRRGVHGSDRLQEYVSLGKRSYAIASDLTPPGERPPSRLLRRLSEEFEQCVCGLGIVREELTRPGLDGLGGGGELIY